MPDYSPNSTWVDSPSTSTPITAARLNNMEAGILMTDPFPNTVLTSDRVKFTGTMNNPPNTAGEKLAGLRIDMFGKGTTASGGGAFGIITEMADSASVVNKTITGAANNGSGLIRITATAHTFATGDKIAVYGVGGVTAANGKWTITVIDANTFDLQGSTFAGTYTSGGTATNRPFMYGMLVSLVPKVDRGGLTGTAASGDDINGYGVFNGSPSNKRALTAYLVNGNPSFSGEQFGSAFNCEADVEHGIVFTSATVTGIGLDLRGAGGTPSSYGTAAINIPNDSSFHAMNATDNGYVSLFKCNTLNEFQVFPPSRFSAAVTLQDVNITLGTTTGTKLGTATSQKLGFWNATPVVRPAGWAAATGTATRTTFATGSVTTAQLAERVKALLDDLTTIGLIGA